MMPAPPRLVACGLVRGAASAEIEAQGAALATRRRPTVRFADGDQKGVKLVEQGGIRRHMRLHEGARLFITHGPVDQAMAAEHTPRVRDLQADGAALKRMGDRARTVAVPDAAERIVDLLMATARR